MFLCVLIGGLTAGLLEVLVFHLAAISSQKMASAGIDLPLGLLLLAVGALVATTYYMLWAHPPPLPVVASWLTGATCA